MTKQPYKGVFPIVPTPFTETGDLDIDAQRRVIDCMIDQGSDGICLLANYSEQFALSDGERDVLLDVCMEHNAGRVPVIVTCSHYSTRIAVERARRAESAGADMLMLMPPYHGALLKADEMGMYQHFHRVAEAIAIPIMVQDAPLSGVQLSISFLTKLAREIPQIAYLKVEMPGTADKIRALIESAGEFIDGPFDGEESITLMADLDAGASGTMCSALLPDLIKTVVDHYLAGRRNEAEQQYNRILPLINFENRQCNLRACKVVMKEGGVIASDAVRHPFTPLPEATRNRLLALARTLQPLALRWGG